jgi:oxepin-CoA hydrolase/3-oxo-5,6-dehydrosuberyl-CoA semialdehyde dehydrogenase
MPQLLHGGPGRAGGGEELGGLRGMKLYMQRVALQGDRALLEKIAGVQPKPA